jgi:hypothetical protein
MSILCMSAAWAAHIHKSRAFLFGVLAAAAGVGTMQGVFFVARPVISS